MPATVSHQLSATTPDDPAYEIQPKHWNSGHAITLNAAGSEISGAFGNGGGVSFGLSADGKVTASAPAAAPSPVNFSAGAASADLGSVVFSNSNGLAFGLNGSTITGSYSQSTHSHATAAYSGSNGSFTAETVTFGSSNGMHFYTTNGSIVGSYTVPTVPAQFSGGLSNGGNTAGDTGVVTGRLVFAGGNNITVSGSTNAGSMTVTISGPNTVAQSNQTVGLYGLGNTTQNSSTTLDARTLSFNGLGGMTVGYSNGSIQLSAPAAQSAQTQSNIQGIGASDTTYNTGTVIFSAQANITVGTSVDGASQYVRLSVAAPGGEAGFTRSKVNPFLQAVAVAAQVGQGTLHVHPLPAVGDFQFNRMYMDMHVVQATATNSSATATVSAWMGLYTRNGASLSLAHSSSTTQSIVKSGTVQSNTYAGPRVMSMGWTTTVSQNDYWVGIVSSTGTAGGNLNTISQYVASDINSNFSGVLGELSNATHQNILGLGVYTAATAGLPASMAFSQINGTASQFLRAPLYYFVSGSA